MFAVFGVVRQLHELLWYLGEALAMPGARPLHAEVRRARDGVEVLCRGDAGELAGLDVTAVRGEVNGLLVWVSEMVRAAVPGRRLDRRGAGLVGADLRRVDLRGASLRGARLVGADLRRST